VTERQKKASQTGWLQNQMQNHRAAQITVEPPEKILSLRRGPYPSKNPGAAVLDLVNQAAHLIEDVNNSAAERQACAEALVKQAIEKLMIADARVQAAESEVRALNVEVKNFRDTMEKEMIIKMQAVERLIEQANSSIAATEAERSILEQRALNAEKRADEAENALRHIEGAIRTQILEKRIGDPASRAA
jgi:hypothetical protein